MVEAWYPGQEDGYAISAVLFGDVNPSGHLPLTFPMSVENMPTSSPSQFPGVNGEVDYSEGLNVGYRWYAANHVKPLFPFGFGLSYTTFKYSNLNIDPKKTNGWNDAKNPGVVRVNVDVTNTGSRAGYAVPQLYIGDPAAANEPPVQLKDFQKIYLQAGQTKKVMFTLNRQSFSIWGTKTNTWTLCSGTYSIMIGTSSEDIVAKAPLTVR